MYLFGQDPLDDPDDIEEEVVDPLDVEEDDDDEEEEED